MTRHMIFRPDSQASGKNKLGAKRLTYKNRDASPRFIKDELAILNAIGRLNRAIAAHEDYLASCKHYGSGDEDWSPSVRIADDMIAYHRPAHHLLIFTVKEIRALRDALNACPLAALRFRVSAKQIRRRWLRSFNRAPPVTAKRPDCVLASKRYPTMGA